MSFKPKNLVGMQFFNHYKNMAQHSDQYAPPLWYQAMVKAPPNNPGPGIFPKKGKIVFPDDALRKRVEKRSPVAKMLIKQGYAPVPWFFTKRPFDEAIDEIKQLINRHPNLTEEDVIDMWDAKMKRHLDVREREMQLQRDEAMNRARSGMQAAGQPHDAPHEQVITAGDSMKIMQMMRDMQIESKMRQQQRLKESLRKASRTDQLDKLAAYAHLSNTPTFSTMTGKLQQTGLSPKVKQIFKDSVGVDPVTGEPVYVKPKQARLDGQEDGQDAADAESQDDASNAAHAEITRFMEENRMMDLEREQKLQRFEVERRLNATVLRKLAAAKELEQTIKLIMSIRRAYGNSAVVYTSAEDVNPFDLVLLVMRAFRVGSPMSPSQAISGGGREPDTFAYSGVVEGTLSRAGEVLSDAYAQFREMWLRYCRLEEIQIDVGAVLRRLDLGLSEEELPSAPELSREEADAAIDAAFDGSVIHPVLSQHNPVLLETGITPPDFGPLVDVIARHDYADFDKYVRAMQPKMEEFMFLLEVEQYLREGTHRKYKTVWVADADQFTTPALAAGGVPELMLPFERAFAGAADQSPPRYMDSVTADDMFDVMTQWDYSRVEQDVNRDYLNALKRRRVAGGSNMRSEMDMYFGQPYDPEQSTAFSAV